MGFAQFNLVLTAKQISISTQSFLLVLSAVLMPILVNLACSLAAEVSTTCDQGN